VSRNLLIENINIRENLNCILEILSGKKATFNQTGGLPKVVKTNNNNHKSAEEIVDNLQNLVKQATLNRVKGVLESYVEEWGVEADVLIPTRISYPKPIFLYLENMEEIPMEIFEWLNDFSKYYDMRYINMKGKLFAFYLYKDFDHRKEANEEDISLYEIYEKEKKSIVEREELKEESVYNYKPKHGMISLRERAEEYEKILKKLEK
jgi:hypothetical protein